MHQIIIGLETPEMRAIEENGDKNQIARAARESITQQLAAGHHQINLYTEDDNPHALIIDGKSLMYALEDDLKKDLLKLATQCASVICCRVSPKQKALVCILYAFQSV
jgi:magnesium-transporting ATPase (P-type)